MFAPRREASPALNRTECSLFSQSCRRGGVQASLPWPLRDRPLDHNWFLGVWSPTTPSESGGWEGKGSVFKCRFPDATQLRVCLVTQLWPTHCGPTGCSLPGSPGHGIFQERIPEWVAMPSSRGSSQPPGIEPTSLMSPALAGGFFTTSSTHPRAAVLKCLQGGRPGICILQAPRRSTGLSRWH